VAQPCDAWARNASISLPVAVLLGATIGGDQGRCLGCCAASAALASLYGRKPAIRVGTKHGLHALMSAELAVGPSTTVARCGPGPTLGRFVCDLDPVACWLADSLTVLLLLEYQRNRLVN